MTGRFLSTILLTCAWAVSLAQNLVPNGDFSNLQQCPDDRGQLELAAPWFSPNGRTTDLAHLCADSAAFSIPQNRWGLQAPLSGNGYAGIRTWLDTTIFADRMYREYVAAPLLDTLIAGEPYFLSFSVSPGEASRYITDDVGMALPAFAPPQAYLLPFQPVLQQPNGALLSDFGNWYTISGQYVAQGGEAFVVIGNFKDEQATTRQFSNHTDSAFESTYLFVDQVIVRPCKGLVSPGFLSLDDTVVCAGQPVPLPLKEGISYDSIWTAGQSLIAGSNLYDKGQIEISLAYQGCEVRDTLNISHLPQPELELGADLLLCQGDSAWIIPDDQGAEYQWADGWPDLERPISEAGTYSLTLSAGPCVASDDISLELSVPSTGLSLVFQACEGEAWAVASSVEGTQYRWSDGLGTAKRNLETAGQYFLDIETECGWVQDTFLLRTTDCRCSLTAENVFTPNADGINDSWRVEVPSGAILLGIEIFDRWGRLIRRLGAGEQEWDGLNMAGKPISDGVYYWAAKLECNENGEALIRNFNGSATKFQ